MYTSTGLQIEETSQSDNGYEKKSRSYKARFQPQVCVRIGPKDCSLQLQDCNANTECFAKSHHGALEGRQEAEEPNDSSRLNYFACQAKLCSMKDYEA
jgi:hypothetical protein